MPDAYSRLTDLTTALLQAIVDEYDLARASLPDEVAALPDRRIATTGTVYFDTEQLSVTLASTAGVPLAGDEGPASEALEALRCTAWRSATFEIMLLRCAPQLTVAGTTVKAPTVEAMAAFGDMVARDAMVITRGIIRAYRAGSFGEGPNIALGSWNTVGPEGDLAGGVLRVQIGMV